MSTKTVDSIDPIPGADAIDVATIGGWKVVVQKGRFEAGDLAVFFEVDAFLPESHELFESFSKRGRKVVISPYTNEEVAGHVLKTAKLRGVISQGLLMKLEEIGIDPEWSQEQVDERAREIGVFKYETPIPDGGGMVGEFPIEYASKTRSARVQNLDNDFLKSLDPSEWVATEKVDGTSSTFIMTENGLKVASRNWEVSRHESLQGRLADRLGLEDIMPVNSVIQGEAYGESKLLQGNPLKIAGTRLSVFYSHVGGNDLDTGAESREIFENFVKDHQAPVLDLKLPETITEAIEQADGIKSAINPKVNAEGIVWWNVLGKTFDELDDRSNFKVLNNKYLLNHEG